MLERAVAEHIDGIDRHLVAHLSDGDRAALEVALLKVARRRLLNHTGAPRSVGWRPT